MHYKECAERESILLQSGIFFFFDKWFTLWAILSLLLEFYNIMYNISHLNRRYTKQNHTQNEWTWKWEQSKQAISVFFCCFFHFFHTFAGEKSLNLKEKQKNSMI